jgi:N-hydroxyarylamine O-acetyltransferase
MAAEFQTERLDLKAYFDRIEYGGATSPALHVLEALHFAHATHLPFENLDILLGKPVLLDMASLQAKLVRGRRGGYCFEHNLLFAAALERLGFTVRRLAARVRYRTRGLTPLTHMVLVVEVGNEPWLADVGFGAEGLLLPVPLDGRPAAQYAWSYRVVEEGGARVLQSFRDGSWGDLYAFTLEPRHFVDYVMANYFTSTYPESPFVQNLTVQLPTPQVRYVLRNRDLLEDRGASTSMRILSDDNEIVKVLREIFGLAFPRGTRFNYRRAAA